MLTGLAATSDLDLQIRRPGVGRLNDLADCVSENAAEIEDIVETAAALKLARLAEIERAGGAGPAAFDREQANGGQAPSGPTDSSATAVAPKEPSVPKREHERVLGQLKEAREKSALQVANRDKSIASAKTHIARLEQMVKNRDQQIVNLKSRLEAAAKKS